VVFPAPEGAEMMKIVPLEGSVAGRAVVIEWP
jgi:hypothetical protein